MIEERRERMKMITYEALLKKGLSAKFSLGAVVDEILRMAPYSLNDDAARELVKNPKARIRVWGLDEIAIGHEAEVLAAVKERIAEAGWDAEISRKGVFFFRREEPLKADPTYNSGAIYR